MAEEFTFSEVTQQYPGINLPLLWTKCERKSNIIANTFIAFKTPLDARFAVHLSKGDRWNCAILINSLKNLGLVIDLTETDQYYIGSNEFPGKNIEYKKLPCSKDNSIPTDEQIDRFIEICDNFLCTNPERNIIGVHCIYGYNQTGYLICAYLCQRRQLNIHQAIQRFAEARPPGIKRQDFINALIRKYDPAEIHQVEPLFVVQHPDILPICSPILLNYFRLKYQEISGWNQSSFSGSKPTLLNIENHEIIFTSSYKSAQITNGIRYMMLIENENEIYLLDQINNIFQINHLYFPHSTNTLLDGEFLIDYHNGNPIYQYLVFDLVIYKNENIGQKLFSDRLKILDNDIINTRDQYLEDDLSIKHRQPFEIRLKQFFTFSELINLSLSNISNGLIFQSEFDSYQFGQSAKTFKCKKYPTIDFRLQIDKQSTQKKRADLFLNNMSTVYASLLDLSLLDQYDNRIVECSYFNDHWHFNRFRPDRKYPDTIIDINNNHHHLTCETFFELLQEKFVFDNFLKRKQDSSLQ